MQSGDENGTLNREPDNLSSYEKSKAFQGKSPESAGRELRHFTWFVLMFQKDHQSDER
jgi:hypothetical protein